MSYDTQKNYFYKKHGKKLRLYRLRKTSHRAVDTEGRVKPSGSDELIYPDENITNGLRIEYTALVKPFINKDPELNAESVDEGNDNGWVEDTSPSETSHVNLNRMLSLAVIDYIKAQMKETVGDLQGKEYCMREFWKKVGDNESNKRNVSMTFPASPFAVK